MILNKKGLMMLPLAALLFTSCSPWKGVDYKAAKEFIDTNYKLDGATAKLPTKVHEKFNVTANDKESCEVALMFSMEYFYSLQVMQKLKFTEEAPYKCNYESDYTPSAEVMFDFEILPIVSEFAGTADYLEESDEKNGYTVTYQTNGKKFKQNTTGIRDALKLERSATYDDKGYRLEVTGKCSCNGEVTILETSGKITANFNFEYSATYTYAE